MLRIPGHSFYFLQERRHGERGSSAHRSSGAEIHRPLRAASFVPETDSDTLRKHINQTYLEAQQNLDHRNAHKRLQFQQLFEIYLPQARHLLLDPVRRAEYDRYLRAYRSGSSVEPAPADAPQPRVPRTASETSSQSPADHTSLTAIEQQVDAEKLAAEREELWAKWKNGLEHSQETEKQQEERLKAQQDAEEAARASLKAATVEMSAVVASNGSAKSTLSGSLRMGHHRSTRRGATTRPGATHCAARYKRTSGSWPVLDSEYSGCHRKAPAGTGSRTPARSPSLSGDL
jgi:curved DNA-binding protein CbpA